MHLRPTRGVLTIRFITYLNSLESRKIIGNLGLT